MKISKFISGSIVTTLLVTSSMLVQAQQNPTIQQLADRWTNAYNANDVIKLGSVYSEDAHLYLHELPRIEGRDEIINFWSKDMHDGNPKTVLKVTHAVQGFDMNLVHGNYEVIDRKSGEKLGFGRFAHIWTQDEKGRWLLDRDLWNQPVEAEN